MSKAGDRLYKEFMEEFGPDKVEPPKTLIRRLACADGVLVEVQINGRVETISEEAANAIKKLGREEVKGNND